MEPIEWIDKAWKVTHSFTRQTSGNHYIYIALLSGVDGKDPGYALYVGQTARTPDERFKQHKEGYKASRHVKIYGRKLLPELYRHLLPLGREEAIQLEGEIAEALRKEGIWTLGGH